MVLVLSVIYMIGDMFSQHTPANQLSVGAPYQIQAEELECIAEPSQEGSA